MHTNLSETFAFLDASRAALHGAVDSIPAALRTRRPAADRWSAVDILEHLSLVERRFTQMLGSTIDDAVGQGLAAETDGRDPLPETVARVVGDRSSRRTAPDPVQPTGTLDEAAAWQALEQSRAAFKSVLSGCDGLALSTVVHAHPFFGPLNAYQWGELIAGHELRHTQQVRELSALLATPA